MENTNKTMVMLKKEIELYEKENGEIDFVKFYAEEFEERDIEKEICLIAKNNLGIAEKCVKQYLIDKWREDNDKQDNIDKLVDSQGESKKYDKYYKKVHTLLKGDHIQEEDARRLCFYLKIPYVNNCDEYEQRFNSVDKFIKTLLHQNGLCLRDYDDIFWYIELRKKPEERMEFFEVKDIINNQKREFTKLLSEIETLEGYIEFILKPENATKLYACFNGTEYYNYKYKGGIEKYVNDKYNKDLSNKATIMNLLKKFNQIKADVSGEQFIKIVNEALTNVITQTLQKQSKTCNTVKIKNEIDESNWASAEEAKYDLSLIKAGCNDVIKNLASQSLTLKVVIDERLRELTKYSVMNLVRFAQIVGVDIDDLQVKREASLYNVNQVSFLRGKILQKSTDESDRDKAVVEILDKLTREMDFESMRYISRLKTKASREAFILVTLALEIERVQNEKEPETTILKSKTEKEFYIEYLDKELGRLGLGKLDPRCYFDALVIIIISKVWDYIETSSKRNIED